MDLALNNLQRLICHKTQQTKPVVQRVNHYTIRTPLIMSEFYSMILLPKNFRPSGIGSSSTQGIYFSRQSYSDYNLFLSILSCQLFQVFENILAEFSEK